AAGRHGRLRRTGRLGSPLRLQTHRHGPPTLRRITHPTSPRGHANGSTVFAPRRDREGSSCWRAGVRAVPARAFRHSEVPGTKAPRRVADYPKSFAMLLRPAQVMGHEIFIAPAATSEPSKAPASRHSTTMEVTLCQCLDFAAQGPQTGPDAVTVSLLKVNLPYQLVNNCIRAGHASGFTEHGHLLSCREFGDYGGGTICRS